MYLINWTRPDIAFVVNLLARHSSAPTKRHWNGVKHLLRYLKGTVDLGLYFPYNSNKTFVGHSDAGYLSNPHNARCQIGYVFLYGGTVKQTIVVTSSNHSKILALYEASHECVWLRSMIEYICHTCQISSINETHTVLFEDNSACIAWIKSGYIKGDWTKHISPKFFYTHELPKNGEIDVH